VIFLEIDVIDMIHAVIISCFFIEHLIDSSSDKMFELLSLIMFDGEIVGLDDVFEIE